MTETVQSFILQPKRVPLSQDYSLSNNVLGLGINGKVIECYSKADGRKYALKVSIESSIFFKQEAQLPLREQAAAWCIYRIIMLVLGIWLF